MTNLMTEFHYTLITPGQTVEHLLREDWQAGKKTVHLLRMGKDVLAAEDGQPVEWNEPLAEGTELLFRFPEAVSSYLPESSDPLQIIMEDDHFLAVYKPAGIAVHPDSPESTGTLMNQVMGHVQEQGGQYAEHVHRLDRQTAGILLIAKHPIAKTLFDRMLEQNLIGRFYTAEVEGQLRKPRGTINMPIGKDRTHGSRRRVSPSGQSAVTHFRVVKRLADSTLVEAQLETGRTHQIRVHFAHLGHPIVGDELYGSKSRTNGSYKLTASKILFEHPFTKEQIVLEA